MIFKNYIDVGEIRFQQIGIASKIFYLTMQFLQYDYVDTSWNSYHRFRLQDDIFITKYDGIHTYLIAVNKIKAPNENYFYPTFCEWHFW